MLIFVPTDEVDVCSPVWSASKITRLKGPGRRGGVLRMKAAVAFFLSLSSAVMAENQPTEQATATKAPPPDSAVHGRVLELLKQDVAKIPAQPKEAPAPFLKPDVIANDQPIAEGVLKLDTFVVTKKKPLALPLRPKLTLDNFFYGDGTIWESADKRFSIRSDPEALLKFNIKF